jgi:acid stress-induced BolA-like protein IbaG/YrbA
MSDPTAAEVRNFIAAGLECTHLEVEGDGRHFFATIVAADFDGKTRVQRHQRVYTALGDRMHAQIHALSMKTLTPAEWRAQATEAQAQAPAHPHHH